MGLVPIWHSRKWQRVLRLILLGEVPGRKNNGPRIRKPSSCPVLAVPMAPLSLCSDLSKGNATLDHTTIQGRCGHHEVRHLGHEVSRKMVLFTKADRGFYCRIRSGPGQATRGTSRKLMTAWRQIIDSEWDAVWKNWFAKSESCTKQKWEQQNLSTVSDWHIYKQKAPLPVFPGHLTHQPRID